MGPSPSRARAEISERDVLTLCDDGDLLLLRECVVHAGLRVAIDRRVAQDIAAFEGGAFPTARVTHLPAWTSCALLLRVSGVLHFLEVDADGMRLVAFQERVAQRHVRRDMYAVRRLQHVRTEETGSFLRQLGLELSQVQSVSWRDDSDESVRSLETALRHHAYLLATVQRMLELCDSSLQTLASPVDRSAQLASAFVIAVYEQLKILAPMDASAIAAPPTPSSLATGATALQFTPATALGTAMRLV